MTFAEFSRAVQEINNRESSVAVEVVSWSYPDGRTTLKWGIWDSKIGDHFEGPAASVALAMYQEAKRPTAAAHIEDVGDPVVKS